MREIERVSQRKKGDSGLKGFVCFKGDRVSQFQRVLSGTRGVVSVIGLVCSLEGISLDMRMIF